MTSMITYSCNLCFSQTYKGYTACYKPNDKHPGTYHLSSIKLGLFEMKEQVSAGGANISHICEGCSKDIYSEVFRNKPKAASKKE